MARTQAPRRTPRILLTIGTFLPQIGGAERQALAHAHGLRLRGVTAHILTLRHRHTWPHTEVLDGVPVLRIAGAVCGDRDRRPALLRRGGYALGVLALGVEVWRRRREYDVVCDFQLNWLTLPVAIAATLAGKPLLVALRCADSSTPSARVLPAPLPQAIPWLPDPAGNRESGDLEMLDAMDRRTGGWPRRLLQGRGVHLTVLSARMRAQLSARGFAPERMHDIPNGVDTAQFAPQSALDAPATEQTVVCVCRLAYPKGVDVLLQAWCLVRQRVPDAQLVLVGSGPLREQLEHLAAALDVGGSVEFTGASDDVATQLNRGAIAVLPSRWEGMPNALLEAMACGRACVATRVSGSEDLINSGIHGVLVDPGDYRALADAIVSLLRDPDQRARMGAAARQRTVDCFNAERVAAEYVALYERMADGVAADIAPEVAREARS